MLRFVWWLLAAAATFFVLYTMHPEDVSLPQEVPAVSQPATPPEVTLPVPAPPPSEEAVVEPKAHKPHLKKPELPKSYPKPRPRKHVDEDTIESPRPPARSLHVEKPADQPAISCKTVRWYAAHFSMDTLESMADKYGATAAQRKTALACLGK